MRSTSGGIGRPEEIGLEVEAGRFKWLDGSRIHPLEDGSRESLGPHGLKRAYECKTRVVGICRMVQLGRRGEV